MGYALASIVLLAFAAGASAAPPQDMSLIPGGGFSMGSSLGKGYPNEHPKHTVEVDAFWMDRHEVTAAQFREFSKATGHHMNKQPFPDEENYPVVYVNWNDAQAYCAYHGKRLPTEAEWEKAARGGSPDDYCFGTAEVLLEEYAWYASNGNKRPHPVGQKKPNDYGLYDMHGNVLEWVSDWYAPEYYSVSPTRNPQGAVEGKYRVVRGGSVYLSAALLRVTHRMKGSQATRYSGRGFRCAASYAPVNDAESRRSPAENSKP
ncbi:MAG: formylglycine-generating enzyme family protein [Elusimicrobiota bacterium]